MNISMWILAQELSRYSPDSHIVDGTMCIRNVSILATGESTSTHTVYVSRSDDFIKTHKEHIICSNRKDYIILKSDDVEEVFEVIVQIIDKYMEWDISAHERIEAGCSIDDVLSIDAEFLKHLLLIVNPGFLYIHLAGKQYVSENYPFLDHLRLGDGMPLDHVENYIAASLKIQDSRNSVFYTDSLEDNSGWIRSLYYGDELQGYYMLFLENCTHSTIVEEQLFEVTCEHLFRWYRINPPKRHGVQYYRMVEQLINGTALPLSEDNRKIWQRIGWQESDEKITLIMNISKLSEYNIYRLNHYITRLFPFGIPTHSTQSMPREISSSYSDELSSFTTDCFVMLLNLTRAKTGSGWEDLKRMLQDNQIPAGISYAFTDMNRIPDAMEQSRIAVRYAGPERGTPIDCKYCALEYMESFLTSHLTPDLSHPFVGTLRDHDRIHHSHLEETARVWLLKERSLVKTATALNIHINTLKYRLKQLKDLGLPDPLTDYERYHLLLSLTMDRF